MAVGTIINPNVTINLINTGNGGVSGFTVSGSYRCGGTYYDSGSAITDSSGSAKFSWVLFNTYPDPSSNNIDRWRIVINKGGNQVYSNEQTSQPSGTINITINVNTSSGGSGGGGAIVVDFYNWEADSYHTAYKMAENRNNIPEGIAISSLVRIGGDDDTIDERLLLAPSLISSTRYFTYYIASDSQPDYDGVALCTTSASGTSPVGTLSSALTTKLYSSSSYITGLMQSKILYSGDTFIPRVVYRHDNNDLIEGSDTGWVSCVASSTPSPSYWFKLNFHPNGGIFAGLPTIPSGNNDVFYTFNGDKISCTHKQDSAFYTWNTLVWSPTITKEGFTLVGWNTTVTPFTNIISTTSVSSIASSTYSYASKTLYAVWDYDSNWVLDPEHNAYCDVVDRYPAGVSDNIISYKFDGGSNSGYAFEIKAIDINTLGVIYAGSNDFYISSSTQSTYDGVALCKSKPPTTNTTSSLVNLLRDYLYSSDSYVTGTKSKKITVYATELTDNIVYVVYRRNGTLKGGKNTGWFSYRITPNPLLPGLKDPYKFRLIVDANGGSFNYSDYGDGSYFDRVFTKMYYETTNTQNTYVFNLSSLSHETRLKQMTYFTFKGWALSSDAGDSDLITSVSATSSSKNTYGTVTVYAIWEEVYGDPQLTIELDSTNADMVGGTGYVVRANGSPSSGSTYVNCGCNFPRSFRFSGYIYNLNTDAQRDFEVYIYMPSNSGGGCYFSSAIYIDGSIVSNSTSSMQFPSNNTMNQNSPCIITGSFDLTETSIHPLTGNAREITKTYNWAISLAPFGNCMFSGDYNPSTSIPYKTSLGTTYNANPTTVDYSVWGLNFYIPGINLDWVGPYTDATTSSNIKFGQSIGRVNTICGGVFFCESSRQYQNGIFIKHLYDSTNNALGNVMQNEYIWCLAYNFPIYQEPNVFKSLNILSPPANDTIKVGDSKAISATVTYTSNAAKDVSSSVVATPNPTGIVNVLT